MFSECSQQKSSSPAFFVSGNAIDANSKSVKVDSFSAGSKISLQWQTHFLWKWSQKDSLKVVEEEGIAKGKALVMFARHCREIAWQTLLLHPIPRLGGSGVVVQIDESKFNHKSKVSFAQK